jgi:EAL domain-containing protein (putative c-di-GMP-specific phosphodiesterase class I)/FixJ family two-component response regulator
MTTVPADLKILVIDDEPFMRKLIAMQLRSMGCRAVLCHESGSAALACLAQEGCDINLLICDLQMPGMDGVEVIRRLGEMGYQGALILVSGEGARTVHMAEKLAKAHALKVLGAMQKPVQPDHLKTLIAKLDLGEVVSASKSRSICQMSPQDLEQGMQTGQLCNHYQPKVCMRTGAVVGVEALVRWQHPEHGLVYPDAFIGVAETHGLINQLTQVVIAGPHGALEHMKQWSQAGLNMHVAVNISMDNLHDLSFPDQLARNANQVGVNLANLVLEITESRLNTDVLSLADILTRLRLKRLRLSIDDFGTGYSSLAQLHELPFDELKIDRSFVHKAHETSSLNSILEASVNMAHDLGMTTTGEGVETVDDWRHLQRKGCDYAQGYWIAKPMPPERVVAWVAEWRARVESQSLAVLAPQA